MSGIKYLMDTNAVLYLLAGKSCMRSFLFESPAISVITEMELLSYHKMLDEEEQKIRALLRRCHIFNLTEAIKNNAIKIRRTHRTKLPDAIIAATAIQNNLSLITADKGFERVEGLRSEILTIEEEGKDEV